MKYSSITTTSALALVALTNSDVVAAASRTRGVERADTAEHRALSPDRKAGGKGDNCRGECKDGAVYYKYVNYDRFQSELIEGTIPFEFALEKTPFNCVLAPVESAADLLEIQAVIPLSASGGAANAWVGVGKSAADVAADITASSKLGDWVNLDGSSVPVDGTLWATGEPNNSPPYQTRAHFYGSNQSYKLRDLNPQGGSPGGPEVLAAVYKCCFDLCPEEPPVDCGRSK